MRVFVISDIHVDYKENRIWLSALSSFDYREDILIIAGDLTDDLKMLAQCFHELAEKFLKVLFVPGNHELWVSKDKTLTSIEKYLKICKLALEENIYTEPVHLNTLSIVPLLGWYDFSFATPDARLMEAWADFRTCIWPKFMGPSDVTKYFLEKNESHLKISNQTVISFSHFLPRIDLMPVYIPEEYRYLYPVLGSALLEKQIRILKPNIHVYGHSHVNRQVIIEGIQYINNAFGYPSEQRIAIKNLVCIYES